MPRRLYSPVLQRHCSDCRLSWSHFTSPVGQTRPSQKQTIHFVGPARRRPPSARLLNNSPACLQWGPARAAIRVSSYMSRKFGSLEWINSMSGETQVMTYVTMQTAGNQSFTQATGVKTRCFRVSNLSVVNSRFLFMYPGSGSLAIFGSRPPSLLCPLEPGPRVAGRKPSVWYPIKCIFRSPAATGSAGIGCHSRRRAASSCVGRETSRRRGQGLELDRWHAGEG